MKISDVPELEQSIIQGCRHVAIKGLIDAGEVKPFAILVVDDVHFYLPGFSALPGLDVTESKHQWANTVRALCIDKRAGLVAFVAEAWAIPLAEEGAFDRYKSWRAEHEDSSLEDYPGRSEIVHVHVESEQGRASLYLDIERSPAKRPFIPKIEDEFDVSWFPLGSEGWLSTSGALTNLYTPKVVQDDPVIRDAAHALLARLHIAAIPIPLDELKIDPEDRVN